MKVSPAKENILKKIRQALSNQVPVPFPNSEGTNSVFQPSSEELEVKFAEEFSKLQGRFLYCASEGEMLQNLHALVQSRQWKNMFCRETDLRQLLEPLMLPYTNDLGTADASITGCEQLIARTGSIVMSTAQQSGRTASVYAPVHICVAYMDQLVYDIKESIQKVRDRYQRQLPSMITLATGPSRTADIEKTLVVGVHGPKEVFVLLTERN